MRSFTSPINEPMLFQISDELTNLARHTNNIIREENCQEAIIRERLLRIRPLLKETASASPSWRSTSRSQRGLPSGLEDQQALEAAPAGRQRSAAFATSFAEATPKAREHAGASRRLRRAKED